MTKDFIYLASASPRRSALLEQIGVAFRIVPADICEAVAPDEDAERYVRRMAEAKAQKVWAQARDDPARAVLAADTTVVIDRQILGKPHDANEALEMLSVLSGRVHRVLTSVALCYADGMLSELCVSEVKFRATTDGERRAYCATGEPLDKAGAYGIQGCGGVFIEWIRGSFTAVVGLPLAETARLLAHVGQPAWLAAGKTLR